MAIFIGAIVVGIVNTAFFRSHNSMEIVSEQRETYQMVRMVMDRMVKDLTCSYVPSPAPGQDAPAMSEDEISLYRFVGRDDAAQDIAIDSIHLTTATDLGLPGSRGGMGEVGYYLKEMDGKKDRYVLIRSEDRVPHYGVSERPREMEMAENVVSLNIRYTDGDDRERDDWDLSKDLTLPTEVEVTVAFDLGGKPVSFTGVAFLPLSGIRLQKKAEGTVP